MTLFKTALCFLVAMAIVTACKKNKPVHDPFFDSFPKKFNFKKVEPIGSLEMYSDKKPISDISKGQKYIKDHQYFEINKISLLRKNDTYEFVSNDVVKYTGANSRSYDTLFFTKNKDILSLKTEEFASSFYDFNCRNVPCQVGAWRVDSIGCYKSPAWLGSICMVPIIAINQRFKLVNGEIRIPALAYRYSSPGFGISTFVENEFNKNVVSRLTAIDTLAIQRFELVFSQQE